MNAEQYAELLEYIRVNNCWGDDVYEINIERNRRAIKYVDAHFDSRDGRIFQIKFRQITGHDDVGFRIESPEDIKRIYKFLDEPMR